MVPALVDHITVICTLWSSVSIRPQHSSDKSNGTSDGGGPVAPRGTLICHSSLSGSTHLTRDQGILLVSKLMFHTAFPVFGPFVQLAQGRATS